MLFQVVKDEVRAVLMFESGVPLSLWRNPVHNPEIPGDVYEGVFRRALAAYDRVVAAAGIQLVVERSPMGDPEYWNIYVPFLFRLRKCKPWTRCCWLPRWATKPPTSSRRRPHARRIQQGIRSVVWVDGGDA
jgi:hypothetical protein